MRRTTSRMKSVKRGRMSKSTAIADKNNAQQHRMEIAALMRAKMSEPKTNSIPEMYTSMKLLGDLGSAEDYYDMQEMVESFEREEYPEADLDQTDYSDLAGEYNS